MARRSTAHPSQRRNLADLRPPGEQHHRDVSGGAARAAVFGLSDGLVSNICVVLAMASGGASSGAVRLAGVAALLGGAASMASGEWNSMTAQRELLQRELDMERRELARRPHVEAVELAQIYMARGVDPDMARELASQMMSTPELALETHAREELGIDPESLGSPVAAAVSSFIAFALGAILPLVPWFVTSGGDAQVASIAVTVVSALILGTGLARFTGRPRLFTAMRQLIATVIPAAAVYGIGSLFDIAVT